MQGEIPKHKGMLCAGNLHMTYENMIVNIVKQNLAALTQARSIGEMEIAKKVFCFRVFNQHKIGSVSIKGFLSANVKFPAVRKLPPLFGLRFMAHTHCTEPGQGPRNDGFPYYAMYCNTTQGQVQVHGTFVFGFAHPVPCPCPCQIPCSVSEPFARINKATI